jgi:hypothetical protein
MAERTEKLGGPGYDPLKGVPPEAFAPEAIRQAFANWCDVAFEVLPEADGLPRTIRMTAELLLEELSLYAKHEG